MTDAECEAEIKRLTSMLKARQNQSGYAANVAAIQSRIAELQAEADA